MAVPFVDEDAMAVMLPIAVVQKNRPRDNSLSSSGEQ
jgi:hypothetical protein